MDPDEDDDLPLSIADTKSILSKKKGDPLDDDFDDLTVSTRSLVDALAGARGVLDDEIDRIDEVLGDASVRRAQHAREFGQPLDANYQQARLNLRTDEHIVADVIARAKAEQHLRGAAAPQVPKRSELPSWVVGHNDYSRIRTRPINRVVSQRDNLEKWLNAEVGNSIGIEERMLPKRVTAAAIPTTPAELLEQYSQSRGGSKGGSKGSNASIAKWTDEDSSTHRSGVSSLSSMKR